MNNCNFTGRITKDAELKTSQNNKSYCYFCIAVDDGKDADGNKATNFIDCIAYNSQAEFLANYIKKGDLLGVTGRLHVTLNEDKDGNKTLVNADCKELRIDLNFYMADKPHFEE